MFTAALCFGGGFIISAFGVWRHQLWLIYLGYGVIGGCGLGLGYISPVSTLVKWFPDRPGMATGLAIMGFGGGAFIGSNLSLFLMDRFKTASNLGVGKTFFAMGLIYFCFMVFGSFIARVPAENWKPAGYTPSAEHRKLITTENVSVDQAWRTPQFWLLWVVLCFNVTAGIGILEQASPMIQEMFPGKVLAAAAGGFVALLSLFNMAWPVSLGLAQRLHRTQGDLRHLSFVRCNSLLSHSVRGTQRQRYFLRRDLRCHSQHVWRRFFDDSCLPERFIRRHAGRRDSRPASHRLVGRRNSRAGARELHP